jgi:hypothetical protein
LIDRAAAVLEVRQHLRAEVPELAYDDAAANLTLSLVQTCAKPAVFVHLRFVNGEEQLPGNQTQNVEVEVLIGLVTQSVGAGGAAATKGARGSDVILPKIHKAIHWWQPSWARKKCKFRGEDDPTVEGSVLLSPVRFATEVQETYR